MKKLRIVNNYRLLYLPDHPKAMKSNNWKGYVYEHIVVAEKMLKRCLLPNEIVHHLDGNVANNRFSNLLIINKDQHTKLHHWLKAGAPFLQKNGKHAVNSVKAKISNQYCINCGNNLQHKQIKYCSKTCVKLHKSKMPSKNTLLEHIANNLSREAIGRIYSVTGNAVKKWFIKYDIMSIPSLVKDKSLKSVETTGEV